MRGIQALEMGEHDAEYYVLFQIDGFSKREFEEWADHKVNEYRYIGPYIMFDNKEDALMAYLAFR